MIPSTEPASAGTPSRIEVDGDKIGNGVVKLVLALVKLLHELLERQAVRRMEGNTLSADEVERVGTALMLQAEEIAKLQKEFGLSDDDLNLDLGPLGRLT